MRAEMGGHPRSSRVLLRRVVLFISIGLLAAAVLSEQAGAAAAATATTEVLEHPVLLGRGRSTAALTEHLGLVYVSRRRVPNGADPIHNRRAGKSVRPPGKV